MNLIDTKIEINNVLNNLLIKHTNKCERILFKTIYFVIGQEVSYYERRLDRSNSSIFTLFEIINYINDINKLQFLIKVFKYIDNKLTEKIHSI